MATPPRRSREFQEIPVASFAAPEARTADRSNFYACSEGVDLRFGSKADICGALRNVCFTPKSEHVQRTSACPLWANSGHDRDRVRPLKATARKRRFRSVRRCG